MLYGCTCRNWLSAGSALARYLQNIVAPHGRTTEFSSIFLLLLHQILLVVYYCCYVATRPQGLGVLIIWIKYIPIIYSDSIILGRVYGYRALYYI